MNVRPDAMEKIRKFLEAPDREKALDLNRDRLDRLEDGNTACIYSLHYDAPSINAVSSFGGHIVCIGCKFGRGKAPSRICGPFEYATEYATWCGIRVSLAELVLMAFEHLAEMEARDGLA